MAIIDDELAPGTDFVIPNLKGRKQGEIIDMLGEVRLMKKHYEALEGYLKEALKSKKGLVKKGSGHGDAWYCVILEKSKVTFKGKDDVISELGEAWYAERCTETTFSQINIKPISDMSG